MSSGTGPRIVTNGLILNIDAANRKSFIEASGKTASLINMSAWAVGTGGVTGYAANETVGTENQRLLATDPWGNYSIVWQSNPSGDSNGDGGWNGDYVAIDNTKRYRHSVWIRRTSSSTGGNYYFGLNTNGTGNTYHLYDGASQGNPYWSADGTGTLTQNTWYLFVGHIFPAGYSNTLPHSDSGRWTIASGKIANSNSNVSSDVKFPSDATTMNNRTYHYYSGDNTTHLQFFSPRIDLCDGTEPTITELLTGSPTAFTDLSTYSNHHTEVVTTAPIPFSRTPNRVAVDGSTHGFERIASLSGASAANTVVIFYSTTDSQELWIIGNNDGGTYLSAAYGTSGYYHGNCGSSITNYVDLGVVTDPNTQGKRNGAYHMWEAKNVNFTGWTRFDWFLYPDTWHLGGDVSQILVYNRVLTAAESTQNYQAFRGRYSI